VSPLTRCRRQRTPPAHQRRQREETASCDSTGQHPPKLCSRSTQLTSASSGHPAAAPGTTRACLPSRERISILSSVDTPSSRPPRSSSTRTARATRASLRAKANSARYHVLVRLHASNSRPHVRRERALPTVRPSQTPIAPLRHHHGWQMTFGGHGLSRSHAGRASGGPCQPQSRRAATKRARSYVS
jgi:hypothetical protein